MGRKKGSPFSLLVAVAVLTGLLWWAKLWPFSRGESPPQARMPSAAAAARQAYEGLGASFREKVPLGDFAGMFDGMVDPATGARPQIRRASVTDATGPEHPRARFHVEYPDIDVKAEFNFTREDDAWTVLSYARVTGDNELPGLPPEPWTVLPKPARPSKPDGRPQAGDTVDPSPKPSAPTGNPSASARRYHTIETGDSLYMISKKYYGTIRHWRLIKEANPGIDPRRMKIGRKIVIPALPQAASPKTTSDTHAAAP